MKINYNLTATETSNVFSINRLVRSSLCCTTIAVVVLLLLLLLAVVSPVVIKAAQQHGATAATTTTTNVKLPSVDKVIGNYLKAVGGKKRVAAIRDATYQWSAQRRGEAEAGHVMQRIKTPGAVRTDQVVGDVEVHRAANNRSAWMQEASGDLRTLTDAEAGAAKLQAALDAGRLVDYKRLNILARTVGIESVNGETAYTIEFATRQGARLRYAFAQTTKLLVQITDDARRMQTRFSDYRVVNGVMEPHRVEVTENIMPAAASTASVTATDEATTTAVWVLREVRHNTNIADAIFDPPSGAAIEVAQLLRDVTKNQLEIDKRLGDYTYVLKTTARDVDDKGVVKKETTKVYEIYTVPGAGRVYKLISENGQPLSAERAEKENKRAGESLEKLDRDQEKIRAKREERIRERAEKAKKKGEDPNQQLGISGFLRASEFVAPRREQFRGREVIVFDFRPRVGFRPSNIGETIASKLAGVVWIDPADRQIMRLEARLAEGFKIGGGLLASIKEGGAFTSEQTRLTEGVWLPRFTQVNVSLRFLLFKSETVNQTLEYSDYKRFDAQSGEDKLTAPKTN